MHGKQPQGGLAEGVAIYQRSWASAATVPERIPGGQILAPSATVLQSEGQ